MNLVIMKTYFDFENHTNSLCRKLSQNLPFANLTKVIYFRTNLMLSKVCFVYTVAIRNLRELKNR